MNTPLKVGTRVKIKPRVGSEYDYRFAYNDEMSQDAGKKFTILSVRYLETKLTYKYYGDGYLYQLANEHGFNTGWIWSSDMFTVVNSSDQNTKDFSIKVSNPKVKLNFRI